MLDERLPGWRDEIEPERLYLGSTCNCVLGQLFDDYERGVRILGITTPSLFGFTVRGRMTWANLTAAWRRELR